LEKNKDNSHYKSQDGASYSKTGFQILEDMKWNNGSYGAKFTNK